MTTKKLIGYWLELEPYGTQENPVFSPPEPRIKATLRCKEYQLAGEVDFFIDTGSTLTTISPKDRDRIVIPPYALKKEYPDMIRFGGGERVPMRFLLNIILEFSTQEGTKESIFREKIAIACPSAQQKSKLKKLDSILGRDFLQQCRIDLAAPLLSLEYIEQSHRGE